MVYHIWSFEIIVTKVDCMTHPRISVGRDEIENMNVAQFLLVLVAVHFTSASLQEYHCNHNVKEQDVS